VRLVFRAQPPNKRLNILTYLLFPKIALPALNFTFASQALRDKSTPSEVQKWLN